MVVSALLHVSCRIIMSISLMLFWKSGFVPNDVEFKPWIFHIDTERVILIVQGVEFLFPKVRGFFI